MSDDQVIPEAALEAAAKWLHDIDCRSAVHSGHPADFECYDWLDEARELLEVAVPHMLAGVTALADEWEADGEEVMALSKRTLDKREATMCLMEGATMVENARLIRNAIGTATRPGIKG